MKRYSPAILLFGLTFLLNACKDMQPISVSRVESARITKFDMQGIEMEIGIRIKNPNSFGFSVFRSELDVTLNNSPLGKAVIKKKVKIKANSEDLHTFVVSSDFASLLGGGYQAIVAAQQRSSVNIGVKGNIRAGTWFYKKDFPVESKQNVPLSK